MNNTSEKYFFVAQAQQKTDRRGADEHPESR